MKMKTRRNCELCNGEAAAYCSADSAFLCWNCDAKVHLANFLVARHVRQILCSNCNSAFTGDLISGFGFRAIAASICSSCSAPGDLDYLSSSACISSTGSSTCAATQKKTDYSGRRKRAAAGTLDLSKRVTDVSGEDQKARRSLDAKAEDIFVNWCTRLGLNGDDVHHAVVRMAGEALGVCLDRLTFLPFGVCLVASLWFGLRFCGVKSWSTWRAAKRLEEISGMPAKLILAAESKLERLYKTTEKQRRRDQLLEEGWAES